MSEYDEGFKAGILLGCAISNGLWLLMFRFVIPWILGGRGDR